MVASRDIGGQATRRAVLALPESAETAATADRLRRIGWKVYHVATGDALRRLACRITPDVVVLRADGADESGWLTCAKLLRTIPRLRVIVVGAPSADGTEFARFVGAKLVAGDVSAEELADHVEGAILQMT